MHLPSGILVALSLLASGSALAADADPKLQGTWKLVAVESDGETADLSSSGARWVIKGDRILYGGEPLATLSTDAASTPRIADVTFLDNKAKYEGIYELDRDTLKLCLNTQADGVKERPAAFSAKGKEHLRVLTFEKDDEAPKGAEGLPGFVGLQLEIDKDRDLILVNATLDDSPAKKAGLAPGDVVLKVGDRDATDLRETVDAVRQAKPGSSLAFRIRRKDKEMEITVKVKFLPFRFLAQIG